jgi:hypothetical protein
MRKLAALITVITIISLFSLSAYAYPEEGTSAASSTTMSEGTDKSAELPKEILSMLKSADTKVSDGSPIITITRPEFDTDSTYKKAYLISGDARDKGYTDVRIVLAQYDSEEKCYKLMKNLDDESSWDLGKYGAFAKEISLSKGDNKVRILAYRTSETGKLTSENVQVCNFTIKLLDQSIIDKVKEKTINILEVINTELGFPNK